MKGSQSHVSRGPSLPSGKKVGGAGATSDTDVAFNVAVSHDVPFLPPLPLCNPTIPPM